jgi:tetratricopeptide (TPR) repeat protein
MSPVVAADVEARNLSSITDGERVRSQKSCTRHVQGRHFTGTRPNESVVAKLRIVIPPGDFGRVIDICRLRTTNSAPSISVAAHPEYTNARWGLGYALMLNNQAEAAIAELEQLAGIAHRSPGSLAMLAAAYARAGNRTQALRLIDELKQRRRDGYIPPSAFITPYLALGEYDQAFFWCDEASKEKSGILQWIKVDPSFDPVRSDPRFRDLLLRVGLGQ